MSLRTNLTAALALGGMLAVAASADAGPGTRGKAESQEVPLVQVVYPVADLVVPLIRSDEKRPLATGETRLMNLLKATVRPESWADSGGVGTLQFYPLSLSLVVRQTTELQGDVAHVLAALRRLQDLQVAVELRLVTMSAEMGAKFRAKAEFTPAKGAKAVPTAFFTAKELYPWMELFQADPATQVVFAPKLTIFNGQTATVGVGEKESYVADYKVISDGDQVSVVPQHKVIDLGTKFSLRPVVSADRRFMRLKLDFRHTTRTGENTQSVPVQVSADGEEEETVMRPIQQPVLQTLAVKHTCAIADGQTLAISVGECVVVTRKENMPPVVNGIPYINQWAGRRLRIPCIAAFQLFQQDGAFFFDRALRMTVRRWIASS